MKHRVCLALGMLSAMIGIVTSAQRATAPRLAEEVYRNINALKGLPAAEVEPLMKRFSRALGVDCAHCHVPDEWHLESKPAFGVARNMYRMVETLNGTALSATGGVTCWSCHGGSRRPSRFPAELLTTQEARWPQALAAASQSVKITMSVYAASLGVECTHCHDPADWKAPATAAHRVVATMNSMFEVFPKFMPAGARTQCWMCHKGTTSPEREPPGLTGSGDREPIRRDPSSPTGWRR